MQNDQTQTVMVVDDDAMIRRALAKLLENNGYTVREAEDGLQALELVERECPDLLITDWEMPGLNGVELCRRLQQAELPHYVYVILLTGRTDSQDMIDALQAGADDFVSKPIDRDALLARLHAGQRTSRRERQLREMSERDSLTGVLNRRTFFGHFAREWARSQRHGSPLSVVLLDVDFFKKLNDTYGHSTGDVVLQQVARTLTAQCRASDLVCRYGGEEFCVLLPETDEAAAAIWAERARAAIAALRVPHGEKVIHTSASLGVAQRLNDMPTVEAAIDAADQCLLYAKGAGRNRVVTSASMHESLDDIIDERRPMDDVLARDVMSAVVLTVGQHESVRTAAEFLLQLRLGSAPVVNADGRLVGIISEKDLLGLSFSERTWSQPVANVMKTNVVCYDETTTAKEILDFLCRVSIRRVVVLKDGQPTGIIDRSSLVRWIHNWMLAHGQTDADYGVEHCQAFTDTMSNLAHALASRGTELSRYLANLEDDFVPYVIGEATRMQDLINDLLSQCQRTQSIRHLV
ncbi:MAG: diguanylate cyclase [Pirellulales bacterium]